MKNLWKFHIICFMKKIVFRQSALITVIQWKLVTSDNPILKCVFLVKKSKISKRKLLKKKTFLYAFIIMLNGSFTWPGHDKFFFENFGVLMDCRIQFSKRYLTYSIFLILQIQERIKKVLEACVVALRVIKYFK